MIVTVGPQGTCEVARHIICAWSCYHLRLEIELKPLCCKIYWTPSALFLALPSGPVCVCLLKARAIATVRGTDQKSEFLILRFSHILCFAPYTGGWQNHENAKTLYFWDCTPGYGSKHPHRNPEWMDQEKKTHLVTFWWEMVLERGHYASFLFSPRSASSCLPFLPRSWDGRLVDREGVQITDLWIQWRIYCTCAIAQKEVCVCHGLWSRWAIVNCVCIHIFPNNVHSISMVTCSLAACDLQHCDDTGCHGSHVTMTESQKRDLTEIHPNHGHLGVGFSRALRICFYLLFLLLLLDILNAVQDCRIFGFSFDWTNDISDIPRLWLGARLDPLEPPLDMTAACISDAGKWPAWGGSVFSFIFWTFL